MSNVYPFASFPTFAGVPEATPEVLAEMRPDVVILGAPIDWGVESGAVPGNRFVQIGLHGYWPDPETVAWMHEQQMHTFFMSDIVEVSPPYDGPGQITAFLANRVVLEILNGMAERKSGIA